MAKKNKRAESRSRYYVRNEAARRGWNIAHPSHSGDVLEEQEIEDYFPDIGLKGEKPDFLFCLSGLPVLLVKTKNEANKIDVALSEAIDYADAINKHGKYHISIAIGAAGEGDKGFQIVIRYLSENGWLPLTSHGYELTNFPAKTEVELALAANDGSTSVSIPEASEFIDAAIEVSRILRTAKVEAPQRPKVIGALVLAMYAGDVNVHPTEALASVNALITQTIDTTSNLPEVIKQTLLDALHLSGADFNRLAPFIGYIVNILRRLNIRSVIHTDADFLGMFYEAFLRYGYDNNALGIVFTPRHITRMCVALTGIGVQDRVIDIACGTGGFLVAAFDVMMTKAKSNAAIAKVKNSFAGFDTNPTVWALAMLNMFFRGDGKSHLLNTDCFDAEAFKAVQGYYTRAYLNPPFSQETEPEHRFIDRAMEALEPGGVIATVVKAGIFADDKHCKWRKQFLKQHRLRAIISLPEDIFYPTSAPTSIMIAEAHIPTDNEDTVFLARVWLDGFEKLKKRRIERGTNQIPDVIEAYNTFLAGQFPISPLVTTINATQFSDGREWSPQEWLAQPRTMTEQGLETLQNDALQRIFQAIVAIPELSSKVLSNFGSAWASYPTLPLNIEESLDQFFDIINGKSDGEKTYIEGEYAYVSSCDPNNSIIRMVDTVPEEVFPHGAITVTCFGLACIQPWAFVARGNGGSSVRVLIPKYAMSFRELLWFAAQINVQRWRIFYARMAIKGRLARLTVRTPPVSMPDRGATIVERAAICKQTLDSLGMI